MADLRPSYLKSRKSVTFSDQETIVDENGATTIMNGATTADKSTAESHSVAPVEDPATANGAVDDGADMFKGLTKKKKKKPKADADGDAAEDSAAPAADGAELDLTTLKKKKKKKPKAADGDDFEAKLVERGVGEAGVEEDGAESKNVGGAQEGDLEAGTGIWSHEATTSIGYPLLLSRFFTLLHSHHPDLASSGSKSYKIPPPQCLREGNKKTIFANISDICKRMKRSDEHVTQYLFAELGTTGSTDGSRRLVIKGRFQQKQLENVLKRYIMEYVTCKTCRSPETELSKGENRLYFVTCNSCGSRRSVTAIKSGFSAQIGKRRLKQQG